MQRYPISVLTGWIKGHQLAAFFIIAFAITWGLGFSYFAVYQGAYLFLPLGFVATCGPALAGIIISAACNTRPRQRSIKAPWIAFLVAWVVSTLVWLVFAGLGVLSGYDPAFDPSEQHSWPTAHRNSPVPGNRPGVDWPCCSTVPVPVLLFQCHRRGAWLAGICPAQAAGARQPLDRQPDSGSFLDTLAFLPLAVSRTSGADVGFLGFQWLPDRPIVGDHRVVLQPQQRQHPGSRHPPCGREHKRADSPYARLDHVSRAQGDCRLGDHPGRTDVEETALRAPGGIQRASYAPGLAVMINLFRGGPASAKTVALSSCLRS